MQRENVREMPYLTFLTSKNGNFYILQELHLYSSEKKGIQRIWFNKQKPSRLFILFLLQCDIIVNRLLIEGKAASFNYIENKMQS